VSAVIELIVRAPTHEQATEAAAAHMRTVNAGQTWDTSSETCLRLLAWLRKEVRR
jgi:hypothetical protein